MICIIEDDSSIVRGFELFLKSANMEFKSFESANKFLEGYQPGPQDLLVLDINLPGMSGTDLLKKLDDDGLHIPVIVVTAFDDSQNREICKKYGVKAYLRKPVDGEALIDLIRFNQAETKKL